MSLKYEKAGICESSRPPTAGRFSSLTEGGASVPTFVELARNVWLNKMTLRLGHITLRVPSAPASGRHLVESRRGILDLPIEAGNLLKLLLGIDEP